MRLQVLVPHWQERPSEMEPLLDSLALQQSVDFAELGVVIACDGPESVPLLPLGDWARYPFAIEVVELPEHVGVSACRNAALDAATADYVMFCDADDMLCDMCGLHVVFRETESGFDTMVSCFREETRDRETGAPVYVNHDMDSTFVHGKIHRRSYLIDNGIRFNDALTVHEDSYFNILAQNLADDAKYCPLPFYLWKWRDESVCRHDDDYILKTYGDMLDSNDALVDEFIRRMRMDKARFYIGFMVMDAYYTMNKAEWLDKTNAGYREAVERRFSEYFAKHGDEFGKLTEAEKMQISIGVRQRSAMEGMLMESVTLDQWLKSIETEHAQDRMQVDVLTPVEPEAEESTESEGE